MNEKNGVPGISVGLPFAKKIASGEVTVFARAKEVKEHIGEEIYILHGGQAFAIVTLAHPKKVSVKEFDSQSRRHGISKEERKERWGRKRTFFLYSIKLLESFSPPLKSQYKEGKDGFAQKVYIDVEDGPGLEPTGNGRSREPGFEDIKVVQRSTDDGPTHPMAKRLSDYTEALDDSEVESVVQQRLDSGSTEELETREIARHGSDLVERKPVDGPMSRKIDRMRKVFGNKEVVQQPESVKKTKKSVEPEGVLARFKKKLEGE